MIKGMITGLPTELLGSIVDKAGSFILGQAAESTAWKEWKSKNGLSKEINNFLDVYIEALVEHAKLDKPPFLNSFFRNESVINAIHNHWYNDKIDLPFFNSLEKLAMHFTLPEQLGNLSSVEEEISIFGTIFRKQVGQSASVFQKRAFDGIEEIKKTISDKSNAQKQIKRNSDYLKREEEDSLIEKLEKEEILLLTGKSFCGKSELAKKIASKFIENGYLYFRTNDSFEAERFLNIEGGNRICLLEDPFGHTLGTENYEGLRRVRELLANVLSNRKLIITSRSEILQSIKASKEILDWSINGIDWVDLTNTDRKLLKQIWDIVSQRKNIPDEVNEKLLDYLSQSDENATLQIGHLKHLSNLPLSKLKGKNIEELCHLARIDSKDLSKQIKEKGQEWWETYIALGLSSNVFQTVKLEDLCYILNEKTLKSGSETKRLKTYTYGGKNSDKSSFKFPSYKQKELIDKNQVLSFIGYFQERGYINYGDDGISFSHPHYKEVANYLMLSPRIDIQNRILSLISNSLFCLNHDSAFLCSKQILFIYNGIESLKFRKKLNKILSKATSKSIFPKVRDKCFSIILENFNELTENQKISVSGRLRHNFDDRNILWDKGIPYLNSKYSGWMDLLGDKIISEKGFLEYQAAIKNKKNIDTKASWDIAKFLNKTHYIPQELELVLNRLINSEEVFIRNITAFYFFQNLHKFNDISLVDRILNDEHPSVKFLGIKGAILSYPRYSKSLKEKILPKLKSTLKNKWVIFRANNLLSTFGIEYGNESLSWQYITEENRKEIWSLWAKLIPIYFEEFPMYLRISNSGRFGSTLDEASKYLSPQDGLLVSNAFFKWIVKITEFRFLDGYELSVVDFILKTINTNKEIRLDLFKNVFAVKDTSVITYSLRWAISRWKELTEEEKETLIDLIKSERTDIRWIKATSITGYSVYPEIQLAIFGEKDFLEQDANVIISKMNPQLLEDCLSMFCGYPNPLEELSHSSEKWLEILKQVLIDNHSIGFQLSLRELLLTGVNGFPPDWNDGVEIWKKLCFTKTDKSILAKELIKWTAICSCNIPTTQELWESLISGYLECKDIDELVNIVNENILALQKRGGERTDFLRFLVQKEFLLTMVLPKLDYHLELCSLLFSLTKEKELNQAEIDDFVKKINLYLDGNEIKVAFISDYIEAINSNPKMSVEIKKAIEPLNNIEIIIDEKGDKLRDDIKEIEYYGNVIEDWHGLTKKKIQ